MDLATLFSAFLHFFCSFMEILCTCQCENNKNGILNKGYWKNGRQKKVLQEKAAEQKMDGAWNDSHIGGSDKCSIHSSQKQQRQKYRL